MYSIRNIQFAGELPIVVSQSTLNYGFPLDLTFVEPEHFIIHKSVDRRTRCSYKRTARAVNLLGGRTAADSDAQSVCAFAGVLRTNWTDWSGSFSNLYPLSLRRALTMSWINACSCCSSAPARERPVYIFADFMYACTANRTRHPEPSLPLATLTMQWRAFVAWIYSRQRKNCPPPPLGRKPPPPPCCPGVRRNKTLFRNLR